MTLEKFSQAVCEKIKHYVYFLQNPKTGKIFYIGKGENNRVFDHINAAIDFNTEFSDSSFKIKLIKEIGPNKVEHIILRHGLTKKRALEIESACIDLIGLDNLANEVAGHNSWERGRKTIDEVIQHYDAKKITITEPAIIININRLYNREMSRKELYEATRASWVLGPKRERAKYAIAAYRGLVREVYKIDPKSWEKTDEGRWKFEGREADQSIRRKYRNQSLKKYISHGSQNPIRYTFK